MNKHILVTGGAGFIGSHTVDALIKKGHKVRLLDSLAKPVHLYGKPNYLNKEAEFILGDVRNRSSWEKSLKGIDIVFHLAAYQDYLPDFSKYFEINAKGTALLYEIVVKKKLPITKIIVASSQSVYGEGHYKCENGHRVFPEQRSIEDMKKKIWDFICPHDSHKLSPQWTTEEDLTTPHNSYGISKYTQEKIALNLGKRYKIPTVALRYSIVQGPRQSPFNLYSGALRIFVTHLLAGQPPIIFEDGQQIRDYINIYDVIAANLLVLENKKADYQIFNVGGGRKWTVADFYKTAEKALGTKIKPDTSSLFRVGDTRHIFSSINRIKSLGFRPQHSIEESIKSYAEWVKTLPNFKKMIKASQKTLFTQEIIR